MQFLICGFWKHIYSTVACFTWPWPPTPLVLWMQVMTRWKLGFQFISLAWIMYHLVFQVANSFLQVHAILWNDMARRLPFQIGQLVESRCFLIGYRGAWFRCKVGIVFLLVKANYWSSVCWQLKNMYLIYP